jgi:hypothetical protein
MAQDSATPSTMNQKPATVDTVIQSLRSMYWDCVSREISHLILAYQEIHQFQPDLSTYETENMGLEGESFKKFCELWCKIFASLAQCI